MTSTTLLPCLDANAEGFTERLDQLLATDITVDDDVTDTVHTIIRDVRAQGDAAVLAATRQFDRWHPSSAAELEISSEQLQQACTRIDATARAALERAAQRVTDYHQHQRAESWRYTEADGTVLGQQVTPLDRVGVYVPGGKASYPSSVLMNILPAKVAGVAEIIMMVPTPDGEINDLVLAAAHIAGVDRVFAVGGAQAIAALAYGTETVPRVDKIVGPGNVFVAAAKRAVFGQVAIDMIAGPSEILVICDGLTDPDWIAMDLFSQAEHDEMAQSILLTYDDDFIAAVLASIERLLPTLERAAIVRQSLASRGAIIRVRDLTQALEISNHVAPEHLELSVADPEACLPFIRHAGAIFMGRHTPEALGDYCAGPNHVLPTSGTARFSSPLGVYDFQKRSSIIYCSEQGASDLGGVASVLARGESLQAHAQSAEYRIVPSDD